MVCASRRSSEALGEVLILGAETVDLGALYGEHDPVGQRADACRARPVRREKRPLSDDCAGAELTLALGCFHDDGPLDHDVDAGPGLAAFDQHLPGSEREFGADCVEPAQIVLVHAAEYRTGGQKVTVR